VALDPGIEWILMYTNAQGITGPKAGSKELFEMLSISQPFEIWN
jgi:hypothetical protein